MWWDKREEYFYDPYGGNEDLHRDGCLPMLVWWLAAGLICALLGSCKTKYMSVPEYHEVIVNKHDTLVTRDSIYEKDSIYIVKNGDTVTAYRDRIYYRDRWRDKIVYRDSIKTDSVRVPMPVVTNKVRWQDKVAYIGTGIFISLVIIIGLVIVIRHFRL
jgi:hypothetical protein